MEKVLTMTVEEWDSDNYEYLIVAVPVSKEMIAETGLSKEEIQTVVGRKYTDVVVNFLMEKIHA